MPAEPAPTPPQTADFRALLDPIDVQRALKLSSRRSARDLIVREMEHVVVGRTPMTTTVWLADWLERQRRNPRQRGGRADSPSSLGAARGRRARRSGPALPPAHRRVKGA